MVVKQDCPVCGRKGNDGHVYKGQSNVLETVLFAGAGLAFFGPIGAAIGGACGNKIAKWVNKMDQTDDEGYVLYTFNCMNPNCKHTWTSKIKE